jgi:hypothetical protein
MVGGLASSLNVCVKNNTFPHSLFLTFFIFFDSDLACLPVHLFVSCVYYISTKHSKGTCNWATIFFQVDQTMQSHQNMPCARLIKQVAGLLRTRFIPDDTRWQAARRGSQRVGLDRFLYLYLLYGQNEERSAAVLNVLRRLAQ